MFVCVFPAVLPGVLTDGWLRPSSIFSFSTEASEALGFERHRTVFMIVLVDSGGLLKAACLILNFNLSLLQPLVSGDSIFSSVGGGR